MRDSTSGLVRQIKTQGGSKSPAGTLADVTEFLFANVPKFVDRKPSYLKYMELLATLAVTQSGGTGAAINPDRLYCYVDSVECQFPNLGIPYGFQHTRGAVMKHVHEVLCSGYNYLTPFRAQVAAANGNYTVNLWYRFGALGEMEFLAKPQETSYWVGWLDEGTIQVKLAASTIFGAAGQAFSTGCTVASTSLQINVHYGPSPDMAIPVPHLWREHRITGGNSTLLLQGMGQSLGMKGVAPGSGLVFMALLGNVVGLAGADAPSTLTSFKYDWREQFQETYMSGPYLELLNAMGKKFGAIADGSTTPLADFARWPWSMNAAITGTLNDAQAYFFPIVFPGHLYETSKTHAGFLGNREIYFDTSSRANATERVVTLEYFEYEDAYKRDLLGLMTKDPEKHVFVKKMLRKNHVDSKAHGDQLAKKARFTRDKALKLFAE